MVATNNLLTAVLLIAGAIVGQVHAQSASCAQVCIRKSQQGACDSLTDPNCVCGEGKQIADCIQSSCDSSAQASFSALTASVCGALSPTASLSTTFSLPTLTPPITGTGTETTSASTTAAGSTTTGTGTSSTTTGSTTTAPSTTSPPATSTSPSTNAGGTSTSPTPSQTSPNAARKGASDTMQLGGLVGVGIACIGAALGGVFAL